METPTVTFNGYTLSADPYGLWPLWVYTTFGYRLHVVARLDPSDEKLPPDLESELAEEWAKDWSYTTARTLCGKEATVTRPGVFSRLGMPRCVRCCKLLGIPDGNGHPRNDKSLRPLFGYDDVAKPVTGEPL